MCDNITHPRDKRKLELVLILSEEIQTIFSDLAVNLF